MIVQAPRNAEGQFSTVIYARRGSATRIEPDPALAPSLLGQAVIARVGDLLAEPFVVASVHTITGVPKGGHKATFEALALAARKRLPANAGSWNAHIIVEAVAGAATSQRFVVGGDFNAAWRFDETQSSHWASDQFKAMRKHGWRRPHLRFHAGEERTFAPLLLQVNAPS